MSEHERSCCATDNATMEILDGARVPIYSWAAEVEAEALRQARNLGDLEIAIDHAALMPDAHSGFGMPIGGVLFAEDAVVPHAIGPAGRRCMH